MMGITWSQVKAAGRHVGSYAAGIISALVAFRLLSPQQGADLTQNVTTLFTALQSAAEAVAGIVGTVAPIYFAWRAAHSASPVEQAKSLKETVPGTTIVTSPEVAKAVPGPEVVANTEAVVVPKP